MVSLLGSMTTNVRIQNFYGVALDGNYPVEYYEAKSNTLRIAWDEMEKIAKAYGPAKISYHTR